MRRWGRRDRLQGALHGDLPPTDATLAACPSVGAILGAVIYNAPLSSGSSD